MSDHNEIKELLAAYALGDLGTDQARTVAEHVDQCESCKQELESIRLVLDCAGQMSKVSVDEDTCISAKDRLLSTLSPKQTQTAPAEKAKTIKWRTIMQSKVTKFAAAAVVIFGAFLGMYMLGISPDGSGVAWASLAEHVQKIQTVTYKMNMTMKGLPGMPKDKAMEMTQTVSMSSEYGMKMEMHMEGKLVTQGYMPFDGESMVTLMPAEKKYMRVTLTDELREQMQKDSYDPKKMVAGFMDVDHTNLGFKEIDGILVEGIEVSDPEAVGNVFPNFIGRMWVDVETDLPVLIEMEMDGANGMQMKGVMTDFRWGIKLGEKDFVCTIPEDYEEMAKVVMPEMNPATAVEGLKMLMEIYDGKFPKSLNMMDLMQDVSKYRVEETQQELQAKKDAYKKAVDQAKAAGKDPNTIPQVKSEISKEMQQKMVDDQMKMQGVCMFYMKLIQEKKDPAYYGDRVTPDDADMILMRWLNDKGGYTVIYGDLKQADLTPEELVEVEALMPEPPKPAETPDHTHTHE